MYKCKAIEVDIPYRYETKDLTIRKVMKIQLLCKYESDFMSLERMRNEYGKGVTITAGEMKLLQVIIYLKKAYSELSDRKIVKMQMDHLQKETDLWIIAEK